MHASVDLPWLTTTLLLILPLLSPVARSTTGHSIDLMMAEFLRGNFSSRYY
jgi:hypothetical protein